MNSAILVEDLSVSFAGQEVLRGLNLEIQAGGPTVLVGRSGLGKTTLLRAVNRLNECLPDCVTTGRVRLRLGGEWVEAYGPATVVEDLRKRVGMVFQTPNVLPVSVERNIALPLRLALGLSAAEIEARQEQALREARLWDEVKDRLAAPAQTLSGGQQQRLCLARALAFAPDILLLDEPTSSLDYKAARGIEDLLLELASRYTLLVVSHSLNQARRLARFMFVLREDGQVEAVDKEALGDKERLLALMDELF
ncbi:MAG: ATP-binding cassette domain-containing protein [Humidesulfovibrio sp.]|nr:ATP-binding cassette domain-containing protein [Humidesulfovibrio sp.]